MYTSKYKISETIRELLQDSQFVLWCYAPTEELDKWWSGWIEAHPEKEIDLIKAREILQSTKLNNTHPSDEDSEKLFTRIEASATLLEKKKQKYLWRNIAAACAILFVGLSSWLYFQMSNKPATFYTVENQIQIDSTLTEIELELSSHEKVSVKNNSIIQLCNAGNIHVNQEEIPLTDPKITKENKTTKENDSESGTETKMNVLQVPRGRYSSVILADGTKVWVNSGTILHFPNTFEKDNRTIYANGEIYLEVTKDISRPFHVKTSKMDIQVLGTSFNVTAYNNESQQSVTLVEGRVEVNTLSGTKQTIRPNDRLIVDNNNQIAISKVKTYDYISWKDGVFIFNDQSLAYVAQRLSRYYQMDFVYTRDIENYSCCGKLVLFDNLNKVLHTLEKTLPISYEITGNKIKLSSNSNKKEPMK